MKFVSIGVPCKRGFFALILQFGLEKSSGRPTIDNRQTAAADGRREGSQASVMEAEATGQYSLNKKKKRTTFFLHETIKQSRKSFLIHYYLA